MIKLFIYSITTLLCYGALPSAGQLMPFKNYGINDGLINNNVQAVIRDDRGLLWIGTDFNVYWFDGRKFYEPQINTNIGQLYIKDFYKDWNGDIWMLTFFNGLYKYHNGQFTNYLVDTLKNAITNTLLNMVQISPNTYLVISDGTAYLFNGQKFSSLDSNNSILIKHANNVVQFAGTTLVSTNTGILLYRYENGKLHLTGNVLKGVEVYKILITNKELLVVTRTGLLSFQNTGPQTFAAEPNEYLKLQGISNIIADKEGEIWVLADTVFKIDHKKIKSYTPRNGLPENILYIYCDDEGLVWFAHRKGLCMLGDEYYEYNEVKCGSEVEQVTALTTDLQNNLWIGTSNGIAMKRDTGYLFYRKVDNEPIGNVAFFLEIRDGSILASTTSGILSIAGNKITRKYKIYSSLISEDEQERQWIGDIEGHIWLSTNKGLQQLKMNYYICEMITCLHAENGNVWIGYRGQGVRKYKLDRDSLLIVKEYNAATGYNDMRVRNCATDTKGNIIWGTRTNGAFIFSLRSDSLVTHLTDKNGLNANWIKGINCGTDGTLYLATNNGVNIVYGDYQKPVIKQLTINNENLNKETDCIVKDGDFFYIGTNDGLLKWMPGNIRKDTVSPPIYFTQISIQGLKNFSVNPYTVHAGKIVLPYEQHFISFEFTGVSLKNPEKTRYQYMLEGESKEWSQPTAYNFVAFNLKPGNYIFKVISINSDGVKSGHPAVFHFIIRPPFWNSWWFITLVIMIIMLGVYGAYRYKVSQLLALERLRNKISTDLHDDIGSTLSSISILSDMAMKESSQTQMRGMMEGIRENSTTLLEKMDDIVWSINPKNDTLENLMVRLQRFASAMFEAKNIEYSIDITPSIKNVKLSMNYRQHIYLILKEIINNLIKYSNCSKAIISVQYHHNQLEIVVTDDGIGFDIKTMRYGNGIINMRQRAQQMNASLDITSQPGAGTKISICLKIK